MPDTVLTTLLGKARAFGGPIVGLVFLAAAGGWALRGQRADAEQLRSHVVRLDATTVKRDTFALFVQEVRGELRLVRRYVCRQSPDLCP